MPHFLRRRGLAALFAAVMSVPGLGAADALPGPPYGDWRAEAIGGEAVVAASETAWPTLEIAPDGAASGAAGCNHFAGRAAVSPQSLTFEMLAVTSMLCADAQMALERRYLAALEAIAAWRSEDADLLLLDDAGETLLRLAPQATAQAVVSIPVPGADAVESQSLRYRCDDGRLVEVDYVNAGPVSLAVLDFQGEFVVAANVIAASGARYAGGRYVWWSRGRDEATLETLGADEGEAPLSCRTE